MPVATLTFNLPDEEDEFAAASRAQAWRTAVADICAELRRRVKYEDAGPEVDLLYQWVNDYLADEGLNPWEP